MNAKDHILTTTGVNSEVIDGDEYIGHILLADYDEQGAFQTLREETANLPGISALFRSSANSHHVWNLTTRTKDETALLKLSLHDDEKHNGIGYRKNRWTLRVANKHRDGERYKDAPEMMDVWVNATAEPQSRPHYELLRALAESDHSQTDPARVEEAGEGFEFVGTGMGVEAYLSITDEMKEEIR